MKLNEIIDECRKVDDAGTRKFNSYDVKIAGRAVIGVSVEQATEKAHDGKKVIVNGTINLELEPKKEKKAE